ncbi:MAG: DUF3014 domain-containing protein [Burkholderiaceae bacterium]
MEDQREHPIRPPTERSGLMLVVLAVALVAAAVLGWRYFDSRQEAAPVAAAPAAAPAAVPADPAPVTPPEAAPPAASDATDTAATEPRHPIDAMPQEGSGASQAGAAGLPALDASDALVTQRLTQLLGREKLLSMVPTDAWVRRVVATVDNLDGSHAAPRLWPVNPAAGRFATQRGADGQETVHPDNARRYAPLVQLAEAVDQDVAVAFYRGLYPLFQQAYVELGYPGRYFNDRLVQVLDHLIATPVPDGPLAVGLVEVKGPVASTRPWVRYEFTDPSLARLSAGQKMLVRTGADQQRRVQAVLAGLRSRVARP